MSLGLSVTAEDEEDGLEWRKSRIECAFCGELIDHDAEVFLLEITEATIHGTEVSCGPVLGDDGDYAHHPYCLHYECYEEVLEEIRQFTEDHPPMAVQEGTMPVARCTCCDSEVGAGEPFCGASFGEVVAAERRPRGITEDRIERLGKKVDVVCTPCIAHFVSSYFELWDDLLEELGARADDEDAGEETE